MISPLIALSSLSQAFILIFTCLALGVALQRARVHLPWLVPLVIGQVFGLLSGLSNIFMMRYIAAQHIPFSQVSWMLIPQQIAYGLRTLAEIWFAVALFVTLKSNALPPQQATPPPPPGSWPPPPSV